MAAARASFATNRPIWPSQNSTPGVRLPLLSRPGSARKPLNGLVTPGRLRAGKGNRLPRENVDFQGCTGVDEPTEAVGRRERQPASRNDVEVVLQDPVTKEHVGPGTVVALGHPADAVKTCGMGCVGPFA